MIFIEGRGQFFDEIFDWRMGAVGLEVIEVKESYK